MQSFTLILVLLVLTVVGFRLGRGRAVSVVGGETRKLHSLPSYYGMYVALWCGIPAFLMLGLWLAFQDTILTQMTLASLPDTALVGPDGERMSDSRIGLLLNDIRNTAQGNIASASTEIVREAAAYYNSLKATGGWLLTVVVLALAVGGAGWAWKRVSPDLRARNGVELAVKVFMVICSTIAIFTTIGIILSLLFESLRFFSKVPVTEFLFGTHWSPQISLRADQVGSSGSFGAIPLFAGTFLISAIAMAVAVPIGLLSAIYMAEYAPRKVRGIVKPMLEILAGIPTVVYGFFAALTVAPFFRDSGQLFGLSISSESALAAGLVMGIMIIPFVSSLSDDVITAVPNAMREGSYGLGATHSETIKRVVLPAALPGIVGGILLAVSRAIGETMIVVMAAGLAANLTANPFEAVTTVTVQIVTLLVGDQEFDSPKTLAAFALGLVLFTITLVLNVIALRVVRKYREQYE
ncbi:Phosphate transport system permease protein PstC [Caenispirillum salinarum AK4]|uniref:Phosphate transport system permease protein n=1 Tax=Caenispirillum salinarum AK4 TaxID=1238182 RepID=K9H0G7_9PROT|nr:phosphate ABC transporter permease subunit PstC [Caenispirillum salinarum]EKV31715.1 Phosphate transport system permease protein PstC [Caenispirillum salinarum AK4]